MTQANSSCARKRRVLCLWTPHLSTDFHRWRAGARTSCEKARRDDQPLVLVEEIAGAARIAAHDAAAARLGAYEGQPLSQLRAIAPGIEVRALDRARDLVDFNSLLEGLQRYSPFVAGPAFGEIFIDTTGCAHLFGDETAMILKIVRQLNASGIEARAALAATPGAAWALAHFSSVKSSVYLYDHSGSVAGPIVPAGAERTAIAGLPVEALRLEPETAALVRSLGLKTVGQILACPRAPLARRLGAGLLMRLDQALGAVFESLSPIAPPPDYSQTLVLADPVLTVEGALSTADKLAAALCVLLEKSAVGARRFTLQLFCLDDVFYETEIRLAEPVRDPAAIIRLLRLKFEKREGEINPGFGFEILRLGAREIATLRTRQSEGFTKRGAARPHELEDRLVNVLGAHVFRLEKTLSRIPERGEARRSVLGAAPAAWPVAEGAVPARPLTLFANPEEIKTTSLAPDGAPRSILWRRQFYRIEKAAGPERLVGEWTRGDYAIGAPPVFRDYYAVEDEAGRRYWVYRDGVYGDGSPKWFLHGIFS